MNTTKKAPPKAIYLNDYKPSDFNITGVSLDFSLFESQTIVTAKIAFSKVNKRIKNLQLVGENLNLINLALDGQSYDNYSIIDGGLIVKQVPENFILSTQVAIKPQENTLLEGLYRSSDIFCTQCEAEGFRHITYFLDRPDVMTTYRVRIEADKARYPVLLSNGNLEATGDCAGGRHFATWYDPFAKPSYLFALVAGDLAVTEKTVQTQSGRDVLLQIYTEKAFAHQADYALGAAERALRWDEETFNLEYDLERYMIVAIGDFNMGAMENKGLNIFNAKYVLATPETATDSDFFNIENIIGHEYFHNWSGNRVTCRDWFQLSLKEGLTVFRDALFSADMTTKGIKRLEEVRTVREHQFIEDQGPMSHPVRPDNYIEINNFYTLTVYEKGAEIIRMMYNLIGERAFKQGIALYFERHDGQAVTVEDFARAMSDASGYDFMGNFFRWYTQSGTPLLTASTEYDAAARIFRMHFTQHTEPTAGQPEKDNLVIPIAYRLFDESGESMSSENVVILDEAEKTVEFGSINRRPVLSLLRNFSAPVMVTFEQSDEDLHTLVRHDDDLFVRFDALENLLKRAVDLQLQGQDNQAAINAIVKTLNSVIQDDSPLAEKAELLSLPAVPVFYELMAEVEIDSLSNAVNAVKDALAAQLKKVLEIVLSEAPAFADDDLQFGAVSERSYRNVCLSLLARSGDEAALARAKAQYDDAGVMTNRLAALSALNRKPNSYRDAALADFYQRFKDDPQVIDKWLALQASLDDASVIETIEALSTHEVFQFTNPNKVRSLYSTFAVRNIEQFHHISGRGYRLLADVIARLDAINPSIAARMVTPLTQWKRFDKPRQSLMREQLQQLIDNAAISKDLFEIVSKSLNEGDTAADSTIQGDE